VLFSRRAAQVALAQDEVRMPEQSALVQSVLLQAAAQEVVPVMEHFCAARLPDQSGPVNRPRKMVWLKCH
jgi:hypothetical protein